MRKFLTIICVACCYASATFAQAWPQPKPEAKPGTRWWWLGSAVNQRDLQWNLQEYARAGIGAVEITPIYGVKGNDANNIAYLYRKALIEREKDTDTNAGNAVDTYLRLAQVVETSPNRDELTAYLPVAYSYVGTYYVNNKRMADAVAVFKKWLAIEPDNQSLKEFIQQFDK